MKERELVLSFICVRFFFDFGGCNLFKSIMTPSQIFIHIKKLVKMLFLVGRAERGPFYCFQNF